MTPEYDFLDCSSYIPTLKTVKLLHPATSGTKILDEVKAVLAAMRN